MAWFDLASLATVLSIDWGGKGIWRMQRMSSEALVVIHIKDLKDFKIVKKFW